MKYVRQRNGTYYVVMPIPAPVRAALGSGAQKWISLGTKVEDEALHKAPSEILALKSQIAAASGQTSQGTTGTSPVAHSKVHPGTAVQAISRWRWATIDEAHEAHFNGLARRIDPFGEEAVALDRLRGHLRLNSFSKIPDFDARLCGALSKHGVPIAVGHPAIPNLRSSFAGAWLDVEAYDERFRRGQFGDWPEEDDPDETPAAHLPPPVAMSSSAFPAVAGPISLKEMAERYIIDKGLGTKEAGEARYYVRRLSEFLGGDVSLDQVTTAKLRDFRVQLRRFPKTKSPEITLRTFPEIVRLAEGADLGPTLAAKTIRTKWFQTFNSIFKFAFEEKKIADNPVRSAMPPKADDRPSLRLEYDADDIASIFGRPLFTGYAPSPHGYRTRSGPELAKDHKYWLPIFSLWHGCRLEEIGSATTQEFVDVEGVWCLDLRAREMSQRHGAARKGVKSLDAKRLIPIHRRLVELGFRDYVAATIAKDEQYVFPELPHDPQSREASTRNFGKWWGLWCRANAAATQTGFDHPQKTFHSFRHSFISACRGVIDEEIRDLLVGHSKGDRTGRRYGQPDIKLLKVQLDKIEFATFPLRK